MAINPNEINIKNIVELIQSSSIKDNDLLVIGQGIYARKSTVLELYNKFGVPSILTSLNSLQFQINQLNNTVGNSVLYSPQVKTPQQRADARNNLDVYSRSETQTVVNTAIVNLGNVVNSVTSVNPALVDNSDPKNPVIAEFREISDYNNDMLNKADIDGNLTIGGIWWQDQVLSDRFANYKQVWTALSNNTIEWGNIELDKHIFLVDDINGLKIKVGGTEGTVWNEFNFNPDSKVNLNGNNATGVLLDAINLRHNHANKSILDAITAPYTTAEQSKLSGIQAGAEVNVNADWNATSGDAEILNKPATFPPSAHTHPISDIIGLQAELNTKLESNDLDGFVYNVTFNSTTQVLTFFRQNQPNVVVDLPTEELIKDVDIVTVGGVDYLRLWFQDGTYKDVPLNTLLVGVVKSVNGLTPNSNGEVVVNIGDIPALSSTLSGKANVNGNNLTNITDWQNTLGVGFWHQYDGSTTVQNPTLGLLYDSSVNKWRPSGNDVYRNWLNVYSRNEIETYFLADLEGAKGLGFSQSNIDRPYIQNDAGVNVLLATQNWVDNNYAKQGDFYKLYNGLVTHQSGLLPNGNQFASLGDTSTDFDGTLSNITFEGTFANFNGYDLNSKSLGFTLAVPTSGTKAGTIHFKAWYGGSSNPWRELWHNGNFDPNSKANTSGYYPNLNVGIWNNQEFDDQNVAQSVLRLMAYDDTINKWRYATSNSVINWLGINTSWNLQQVTNNGASTTNIINVNGLEIGFNSSNLYHLINSSIDVGFTKNSYAEAQRILTGGLLASDNYADASLIPVNGGYFKGNVVVPNATAPNHAVNKSQLDAVSASIPNAPNNGLLTISTSADLTGGGTFSADQATASNVNIGLSASTLASLALANTAVQPSALSGYVPTSRTLTINGTTFDLSQDRTWNIPVNTYTGSNGINVSGTVISPTYGTTAGTIAQGNDSRFHNAVTLGTANGLGLSGQVLSLGLASSSSNGALSSTDWNTFNSKVSANNGQLSFTAPTGLNISGTFSANQSANTVIPLTWQAGYQGFTTAESNKLAGIQAGATVPNNGTFTVQGTGALTGSGSTSANTSANTSATLDLTAQTKADIQQGVEANTIIPSIVDGVMFYQVTNANPFNIIIERKKTIVNVADTVLNVDLYVEDGLYDGYELVINGCNEWSANLKGNVQDKCGNQGGITFAGNSGLFWWSADESMWIQVI